MYFKRESENLINFKEFILSFIKILDTCTLDDFNDKIGEFNALNNKLSAGLKLDSLWNSTRITIDKNKRELKMKLEGACLEKIDKALNRLEKWKKD